jgi:hypothetical protein
LKDHIVLTGLEPDFSGLFRQLNVDEVRRNRKNATDLQSRWICVLSSPRGKKRTREALAAKDRGVVLGNPGLANVRKRAAAGVKANADRSAKNVLPVIRDIQSSGVTSHRGIARTLNARGVATARGGQWTAVQVGAILQRLVIGVKD